MDIEAEHYRGFWDTLSTTVWNNSDFPVLVEIVISLMDRDNRAKLVGFEGRTHWPGVHEDMELKAALDELFDDINSRTYAEFGRLASLLLPVGFKAFYKKPDICWIGATRDKPNAFRITLKLPEWAYLKINHLPKSEDGQVSIKVFKEGSQMPILKYSGLGEPPPWYSSYEEPPPYKYWVNNAMVFENAYQELLKSLVGRFGKDAYEVISDSRIDELLMEDDGIGSTDYPKWFKLGKLSALTVTDTPKLPQPRNMVEKVLSRLSTINRPEPKPFLSHVRYDKDQRTLSDIKRLTVFTFEQNPSISGLWSPGVKNPRSTHGRWN